MFSYPFEEARPITRRALLRGGFAGAVVCAFPLVGLAATPLALSNGASNRRFSVLYKGLQIGTHTVSYSFGPNEMRVNTEIHLLVKLAFLSLFAFTHHSEETWRAGHLMSLDSETIEHGEALRVMGRAGAQGFRVVSKGSSVIAPAGTFTSDSLWTPAILEQSLVVDAQHGGLIDLSARKLGDERISVAGRQVYATRYTLITPSYTGSVWYDKSNQWVRGEFERDGSIVQYEVDA